MSRFQYILDSHTWISLDGKSEKIKVSQGEIIELDEKAVGWLGRLHTAGFRIVKDDVEVEVKDDGKDEITIKVEKPSKKSK